MLPIVRQEANAWHDAAFYRQHAIDSLKYAVTQAHEAQDASDRVVAGKDVQLASKSAEVDEFKQKAHRRGLLVVALVVFDVLVGVLLVTH